MNNKKGERTFAGTRIRGERRNSAPSYTGKKTKTRGKFYSRESEVKCRWNGMEIGGGHKSSWKT